MRLFTLAIAMCLFWAINIVNAQNNTPKKTAAAPAKNSEAKQKLLFDKFFELNDGDSADVVLKSKIGTDIYQLDNKSKYGIYVSAWANTYAEQYDAAIRLIEQLKKDYADWAEVYFLHAQYLDYKEQNGFIEQAQKCIEMNPKLIYPLFFLATKYEELENYKLALRYYDMLEKAAPTHKSVFYNRGYIKSILKDSKGAISDYTKALQLNPKHHRALFNRGREYMFLKEYANAETDFDTFIKVKSDYDEAYYYRGAAKYYQKKQDAACVDMKKAAQLGHKGAADFVTTYCQ